MRSLPNLIILAKGHSDYLLQGVDYLLLGNTIAGVMSNKENAGAAVSLQRPISRGRNSVRVHCCDPDRQVALRGRSGVGAPAIPRGRSSSLTRTGTCNHVFIALFALLLF